MKLSYRGVSYEQDAPTIEVTEGEIVGKYRGQDCQVRYPRHIPVPGTVTNLKYRGTAYCTGRALEVETPKKTIQLTADRAALNRLLDTDDQWFIDKSHNKNLDEVAKIHHDNIRRSLEHRLQVAKANGNQSLISQLEAESKQLTLHA